MKLLTFLASVLLICTSCNCQKKAVTASNSEAKTMSVQPIVMEYEAYTRGFYYRATIENQSISVTKQREIVPIAKKISDTDWKEILELYKKVNLKGLPSLKAPSEARFYDGAAIAHFKIISGKTPYQSSDFDAGNPPVEIKIIVEKILALAEKQ
ncbi:MAG: hypothetical protein V4548_10345 [Bacteroidota bacterium]